MTQLFDDKGDVRPVTVLQAGPCVITQLKTATRTAMTPPRSGWWSLSRIAVDQGDEGSLREARSSSGEVHEGSGRGGGRSGRRWSVKVGDKVLVDLFDGTKFVDIRAPARDAALRA